MEPIQEVVLIRSQPGGGKTTYAKLHYPNHVHLEADMYFALSGTYQFDASKLRYAHEWCQSEFKHALQLGSNVVVSNTFIKLWEMKFYLDYCKDNNIIHKVIRLTTQFNNVHGVPSDKVEQMRKSIQPYAGETII